MDIAASGGSDGGIGAGRVDLARNNSSNTKKNELKPWQRKHWCIGNITGEYLARMEDILGVYERGYEGKRPVVCFDERPCQLHEGEELPMRPGAGVRREDSHYRRNGTCCVLLAVEPLRGRRMLEVQRHRGAKEYARFVKRLATQAYPEAERIVLIQDNLSTHHMGSLYETFPAEEARALAQRFEVHYTPNKGSWLNMAEIEFSAMTKQCLDRRIGSIRRIQEELRIWQRRRTREGAKIRWRFTTDSARCKLRRHYSAVRD